MTLAAALQDRYRIERELGQGGMATVYLAHDLRHERKVAIKVLRPDLAAVIGAERFVREIRTIAALQHPHILGLIDSGEVQGTAYYVMPFVEGESLRDRLRREKQLPVPDAVRLATEAASALDYAHRHGVIHRDIKPENILLHDGRALVADFGIALAVSQAGGTRMTETGMSLGTPHYMSPEQAMGEREITARSDVYALGCVLYEMLTGDPPFLGSTAQAIVAKVLTEKPAPPRRQRERVPEAVEAAVLTALEKLPADRFATAAEFAAALTSEQPTRTRTAVRPGARVGRWSWVPAASIAAALALGVGVLLGRRVTARSDGAPPTVRATLDLGDSAVILPIGNIRLAIAPTGRRLAFIGSDGRDQALWVRELDQPSARRLPDTKGAFAPFFSPDGESIGFFTAAAGPVTMKIVPAGGGVARTVVKDSIATFGGADWSDDGQIYFTNSARGLSRVDATGGRVTRVAVPDSAHGIRELDYADVLPGSRQAFVMMWKGSLAANSVGVVDLKSGTVTELAEGSYPRYLHPGFLAIGAAGGRILISRYDPKARRLADSPALVLDGVQNEVSNGTVEFAVADNGTLVYQPGQGSNVSLVWVDRSGRDVPVDTTLKGDFSSAALSPDASQIALAKTGERGSQIWVKQLRTGAFSPISQELQDAYRPAWTPDGRSVGFLATLDNHRRAWIRRADGSDSARMVGGALTGFDEIAFERSGRYTLFRSEGSAVGTRYLLVLEQGRDTLPRPLVRSRYDNYAVTISPDGRWLAYVSDESGSPEVYVRPFPSVDSAKFAVSLGGGQEPLWRRDGAELFYRNARGDMYAVTVGPGRQFEHGPPRFLFSRTAMALQDFYRSYDVHPDGKRFLMLKTGDAEVKRLSVIFNWRPEMQTGESSAR